MSPYQPVPNPFPGTGPIPAGSTGFYKRTEVFTIIQDLLRAGDSISLVGERKAGKTSFLNYLAVNLPPDEFIPVSVDAQIIVPRMDQVFLGELVRSAARAIAKAKAIEAQYVEVQVPTQKFLGKLLELLDQHFNEEELRTLCFYLGVDYENLPAAGKVNKARELVAHLRRTIRLSDLVSIGRQLRPKAEWEDVPMQLRTVAQGNPLATNTLNVEPNEAYDAFRDDLDRLRSELPVGANGQRCRLVWLIDEIETLQGYENSELFVFLRPLAQSDPDFRMVVAGYDVLYTLSSRSKWSPFYNAFRHTRLKGLNPVVAQELIDDALSVMGVTIEPGLYTSIFNWTGQKPFFLKWTLSKIAEALNQQRKDYRVYADILEAAETLFLAEKDVGVVFRHLWETHTTPRQQLVLSLMATEPASTTHPQILARLKERKLLEEDKLASQHLVNDLTRLEQLGFLYEQIGQYTFTSECLQAWIAKNKPL